LHLAITVFTKGDVLALLKKTTDQRPVFLNLLQIQLPLNALVSILHRVTGVVLILLMPLLVLVLADVVHQQTLWRSWMHLPIWFEHLLTAGVVGSLMYHLLAGLRHMYHDFSGQHSLQATRHTAMLVLILWLLWMLAVGGKLWLS